jgi:hypothetical protein
MRKIHKMRHIKQSLWTLEDGTDKLFRNVGKELPLLAEKYLRREQFSSM